MLNSRIHDMAKELGKTCIYNFQFAIHVPGRVWGGTAFAKRCGAMKAPVGLLSGSAVCDSRWRGVAPTGTPNKSTSETRKGLRSEVPDGPSSTRGQEPSASIGGFLFCWRFAGWCGILSSTNQTLENDYAKDPYRYL